MILGIFGLIGAGKSAATKYLGENYDFEILDLDKISKIVMNQDDSKTFVRNYIPEAYVIETQSIDNSKLREILFSDFKRNKYLSKYIWPKVSDLTNEIILSIPKERNILLESALLPLLDLKVDKMIYIASNNLQKNIARVINRDGRSLKETTSVINIQKRLNKNADYDIVIINDKTIENLHVKLDLYMNKLGINKKK
ncbi:dephospho-CoA kinase [Williamsoniiplasma somnilux]|uniref:Dephospho-CoA kinase n=1 Tax=Williamsoniiplasma somnilux TaxID=215578 RepID=A0A2K8NY57_9MOLU|nr:dephospho-CoA kinase [Williamsoniiplasma somnilux]ATZ18762.1 dephospho-CoA kinase [Williamsoniiplasma somnilux]